MNFYYINVKYVVKILIIQLIKNNKIKSYIAIHVNKIQ